MNDRILNIRIPKYAEYPTQQSSEFRDFFGHLNRTERDPRSVIALDQFGLGKLAFGPELEYRTSGNGTQPTCLNTELQ